MQRASLGWRLPFSSNGRRVNDRRSPEAAASPLPEAELAEVAIPIDQLAPAAAADAQHPLSRHMSLQRADRSGLSALVEQLSSLSDDVAAALEEQLLPASPTKTPPQCLRQGDASLPPLALSPVRRPALAQVSMSPLMLSPSRKERSAPPVAHESVQIGQPSSSDALKEVHAEIMDRGVQLAPSGSSRRASLSRHSSEIARRSLAASPSAAAPGAAGGPLPNADFHPLTLAQTWARISRPPLPATRGSAAASPVGPPRPRVLTSWRSMPSSAQRMSASSCRHRCALPPSRSRPPPRVGLQPLQQHAHVRRPATGTPQIWGHLSRSRGLTPGDAPGTAHNSAAQHISSSVCTVGLFQVPTLDGQLCRHRAPQLGPRRDAAARSAHPQQAHCQCRGPPEHPAGALSHLHSPRSRHTWCSISWSSPLSLWIVYSRSLQQPSLCQSIICRIDFHWYFRLCALYRICRGLHGRRAM